MIRKLLISGSVVCLAAYADFSYEQTSKITGGAMQSMMRVAGVFSKSAREPMKSTVMVKGDRMATLTGNERIDIIDLNAETFTEVDLKKKTYSVTTFEEMARAMEKAAAEARKSQDSNATMNMKADVKYTGATRNISGMDTKQALVNLKAEIEDKQQDAKGEINLSMDMWLAPQITGYDEVRNFYIRLANTSAWSPFAGVAGAMMAGHAKAMSELVKEMSKLEGVPVLQVMRVGGMSPSDEPGAQPAAAQEQQQAPPPPSVNEAAGDAAAGAAVGRMGRLGGLAGGFGGFGRRKKQKEQEQVPPPQPAAEQQSAAAPAQAGVLMEVTSELSGFSSAAIDSTRLEVPAGFKQVKSERYKQ
jgi:hypothetical protein